MNYFDLKLCIPKNQRYIATDENGYICSYKTKPIKYINAWNNDDGAYSVGRLKSGFKKWVDSLVDLANTPMS